MARHVYYIPDCPECGAEMVKKSRFNGEWHSWWHCDQCGHDTEEAEGKVEFDRMTKMLTAGLRKPGDDQGAGDDE